LDDAARTAQNDKEKEENLKNDPDGSRIFKGTTEVEKRKYIFEIVGDLPVILSQLNNSGGIVNTYIYVYPPWRANSQIIERHEADHTADRYFYLHDRLYSVCYEI